MCRGCWEEYGSPAIDTPEVRAAAEAIRKVYEFSCVGGNLHVCIDDWNLDILCEEFVEENVHEAPLDQIFAERACIRALKPLSEEERASALGLHDGFWGGEVQP